MTYQDNLLPDQNAKDGHTVIVVSDCYKYEGGDLVKTQEEDRWLESGVRLVRFEYDRIISELVSRKVRKVHRLYGFLCFEKPDVVLFHGVAGWEMLSVARYKRNNPYTKLYLDSHEDAHNSGTFWLSMFFQYKVFNRFIVNRIKKQVDKFLYLSYESKDFLHNIYRLSDAQLEFYPLGGYVVDESARKEYDRAIRHKYGLRKNDILIVHSGKLDAAKKTEQLLNAFYKVKCENLKIFIIGSIPDYMRPVLLPLIERDTRVIYLGWKNGDELVQYLCAADLYFQPGTQSATMQNAICCGSPVALYPYPSHKPYLVGNGFYVECEQDYIHVFEEIIKNPSFLEGMKLNSIKIAENLLSYKKLAARLYK